jgi:hypothetical protein
LDPTSGEFLEEVEDTTLISQLLTACKLRNKRKGEKYFLLEAIQKVKETAKVEKEIFIANKMNDKSIGNRLMFLFQCDLLPKIQSVILENEMRDGYQMRKSIDWNIKLFFWGVLLFMECCMLFYIFLFSLNISSRNQTAWVFSFFIALLVDIILVCTILVLIVDFLIPWIISTDVHKVKKRLFKDLNSISVANESSTEKISFDASKYLFVSSVLARQYPDLKESKVIGIFDIF